MANIKIELNEQLVTVEQDLKGSFVGWTDDSIAYTEKISITLPSEIRNVTVLKHSAWVFPPNDTEHKQRSIITWEGNTLIYQLYGLAAGIIKDGSITVAVAYVSPTSQIIEFTNEDIISFYTKTTATNDVNMPVFNSFASDGTLVIKDRNLDIFNLAIEGFFDSYNYPVNIYIQNSQDFEWKQIASHIVKAQPKYSYVDKTLTIELGNGLDVLDSLTYAGYEYKWESGTLYDIFADLMKQAFNVDIATAYFMQDFVDLFKDYKVEIPYMPQKSFREAFRDVLVLVKCCLIIDENGDFSLHKLDKYYGNYADDEVRVITASTVVDNVQPTVILNNKFDNVEFAYAQVEESIKSDIPKDFYYLAPFNGQYKKFPNKDVDFSSTIETEFYNTQTYFRKSNGEYAKNEYAASWCDIPQVGYEGSTFFHNVLLAPDSEAQKFENNNGVSTIEILKQKNLQEVLDLPNYIHPSNILVTIKQTITESPASIESLTINTWDWHIWDIFIPDKINEFIVYGLDNYKVDESNPSSFSISTETISLSDLLAKPYQVNGAVFNMYSALFGYDPNYPADTNYAMAKDSKNETNSHYYYNSTSIPNKIYQKFFYALNAEASHYIVTNNNYVQFRNLQGTQQILELEIVGITFKNAAHLEIDFKDASSIDNNLDKKNVLSVDYSEVFQNYDTINDIRGTYLGYYQNGLRTAKLNVLGNYPYKTLSDSTNSELFKIGDAVEIKNYENKNLFSYNYTGGIGYLRDLNIHAPSDQNLRWQVLENEITYDGGAVFQDLQVKELPIVSNNGLTSTVDIVDYFNEVNIDQNGSIMLHIGELYFYSQEDGFVHGNYPVNGNWKTKLSGITNNQPWSIELPADKSVVVYTDYNKVRLSDLTFDLRNGSTVSQDVLTTFGTRYVYSEAITITSNINFRYINDRYNGKIFLENFVLPTSTGTTPIYSGEIDIGDDKYYIIVSARIISMFGGSYYATIDITLNGATSGTMVMQFTSATTKGADLKAKRIVGFNYGSYYDDGYIVLESDDKNLIANSQIVSCVQKVGVLDKD